MRVTLYDDVGGIEGLRQLSEAFYDRVPADELLAPVFATSIRDEHRQRWLEPMAEAIERCCPAGRSS